MNLDEAMKALERAGTETAVKTYLRHGAKPPLFGVPYAALYALQKRIGTDQRLAEALWATGNHDARVLATLVADGAAMPAATLERWRKDSDDRFGVMSFASLAARCAPALACARRWIDGKGEFEQAAGWGTLAALANARAVGDDVFTPLLGRIERTIHRMPNLARYMANNCLIAIGSRPSLAADAMRVARAVGRVEVDHGDTQCETPLATEYLAKIAARAAAKGKQAVSRAPWAPKRGKAPQAAPAGKPGNPGKAGKPGRPGKAGKAAKAARPQPTAKARPKTKARRGGRAASRS